MKMVHQHHRQLLLYVNKKYNPSFCCFIIHYFYIAQLASIKNVTMAGLICNNYDLTNIQPSAFKPTKTGNPVSGYTTVAGNARVSCSTLLGQLNLNNWSGIL